MTGNEQGDQGKIVLANWKANLSPPEAVEWCSHFSGLYRPYDMIRVVLAVPFLSLLSVHGSCQGLEKLALAAQDVSPFPRGGYTGETPAVWLSDIVEFVLVGHRERRKYFHETVQDVANKVSEAVDGGLCPILCSNRDSISRQLAAIDTAELNRSMLAYTPDDADALDVAESPEVISAEARRFSEMSGRSPVLYGGGVQADNVADLITVPELAGVLVAKGCLDPREFISLLDNADRALAAVG